MLHLSTEPGQVPSLMRYFESKLKVMEEIAATAEIELEPQRERAYYSRQDLMRQTLKYRKLLRQGMSKRQAAKHTNFSMQALEGKIKQIKVLKEREKRHKKENSKALKVNQLRETMTLNKALKFAGITENVYRSAIARMDVHLPKAQSSRR